jgi:hypothetical protein
MTRLITATALALALSACGPPRKDPAVVACEQFVAAVRQGRADAVWKILAPHSREVLAGRLGVSPDAAAEEVEAYLGVRPGAELELDLPRQVRLIPDQTTEDRRVVLAPLGDHEVRLSVVLVGGEWRVDLFGQA